MRLSKIAAAVATLAAPAAALADPVSATAFLVAAASASAGYLTAAVVAGSIGLMTYGTARARSKARAAAARERRRYNASLQDRNITTLQSVPPQRIVYGRAIVGGEIHAIFTTGKTGTRTDGTTYTKPDALKHLVIAIADHECEAIHEVYIDGIAIGALDGNGQPTGGTFAPTRKITREISIAAGASSVQPYAVTVLSAIDETATSGSPDETAPTSSATYTLTAGNTTINNTGSNPLRVTFTYDQPNPVVRVQKALGTAGQTVNAYLNGLIPSKWTANHRLRGIAYVILTLDLEEQRFQGGPPGITFDVSGKKLYDPRTTTTVWSDNPALCVRDFLLGEYGYQVTAGDVDDAYITAAANICDQLITLTIGGSSLFNRARYTCNGSFTTDQAREAVLEEILETMAGTAVYGAKWQVMAGAWTASVMDLGDDDLHGQIEVVQADVGMEQLVNGVRGQYVPRGKATPTDMDSYQNATFLAADGVALWDDISLPFVDNKARARNLARIRVELARAGQIIRFPAKLRAWPLQVGDRVRVTSAEYGWTNKTYRVTDWQFGTSTAVMLTLQEDTAGIWDLADAATEDPTPNSGLLDPWTVAALSSVTAASGAANQVRREDGTLVTRVRVSWAAVADPYVADGSGQIRIEWRRQYLDAANAWQVVTVPGDEVEAYIQGVTVGNLLTIRVMAVNGLGARGNPVVLSHTVTGSANSTGGGNLVSNSSFEADSDADGVPDSWTSTSFGSGITIARELSAPALHGSVSLRLNVTAIAGASTATHVVLQSLAESPQVTAGCKYRVGVDSLVGNVNYRSRFGVVWLDSADATISTSAFNVTLSATNTWNRLSGAVLTAPTGAVKARPFVGLVRPSVGDTTLAAIRFDRFQLEEGDVVTNYAPRADELLPEVATKITKLTSGAFSRSIAYSANRRREYLKVHTWVNDTGADVECEITASISIQATAVGGSIIGVKMLLFAGSSPPDSSVPVDANEADVLNAFYENNDSPLVSTSAYSKFVDVESITVPAGATAYVTWGAIVKSNTQTSTTLDISSLLLRITAVKK